MVLRQSWRSGPHWSPGEPALIAATRFAYKRRRDLFAVGFHATRLRRAWHRVPGAVGLVTGSNPMEATTYSVSVWKSQDDLRRFLRSEIHGPLMRRYRPALANVTSVSWDVERFSPEEAWREARRRLAA